MNVRIQTYGSYPWLLYILWNVISESNTRNRRHNGFWSSGKRIWWLDGSMWRCGWEICGGERGVCEHWDSVKMLESSVRRAEKVKEPLRRVWWRSIARCLGMARFKRSIVQDNYRGVGEMLWWISAVEEYIQAPSTTASASNYAPTVKISMLWFLERERKTYL
jgi:hypothetical protein